MRTRDAEAQHRIDQAKDLAEWIAVDRFGDSAVNPRLLVDALPNLTLSVNDYSRCFDGLLEYDGRSFHVYCQEAREERVRFSLAHELGHYFIDDHRLWLERHPDGCHRSFILRARASGIDPEREADAFASSLLLPESTLRAQVRMPPCNVDAILATAQRFGTSRTATAIRFAELDLIPCAVIKWTDAGEYEWSKLSARVASRYPRPVRSVPQDSATAVQLAECRAKPEERTTVTESWFPSVERDFQMKSDKGGRSLVLREFAISLGGYGVLTIITGDEWVRSLVAEPGRTTRRGRER